MILVPYIHTSTMVNGIHVQSYMIMTIGGTDLWTEDDTENPEHILAANDLYATSIVNHDNVYLCRIDQTKTMIESFYKWNEVNDMTVFCWRTLYTFGEHQDWLPHPCQTIGAYSYQELCEMISESKPSSRYL